MDINFYRETSLPSELEPASIYLIGETSNPDLCEIYVTSQDGLSIKRVITEADVLSLIDSAINNINTGSQDFVVVDNIVARNLLTPTEGDIVFVVDATEDSTVIAGGASYVYSDTSGDWIKISELPLSWNNLQDKPVSSVLQIDSAVAQAHQHSNLDKLQKIDEDVDGNLLYDGKPITATWTTVNW